MLTSTFDESCFAMLDKFCTYSNTVPSSRFGTIIPVCSRTNFPLRNFDMHLPTNFVESAFLPSVS